MITVPLVSIKISHTLPPAKVVGPARIKIRMVKQLAKAPVRVMSPTRARPVSTSVVPVPMRVAMHHVYHVRKASIQTVPMSMIIVTIVDTLTGPDMEALRRHIRIVIINTTIRLVRPLARHVTHVKHIRAINMAVMTHRAQHGPRGIELALNRECAAIPVLGERVTTPVVGTQIEDGLNGIVLMHWKLIN